MMNNTSTSKITIEAFRTEGRVGLIRYDLFDDYAGDELLSAGRPQVFDQLRAYDLSSDFISKLLEAAAAAPGLRLSFDV